MLNNIFTKAAVTISLIGLLALPATSQAYWVTEETVFSVGNTTIFITKYREGSPKNDIIVPVLADRMTETEDFKIGFELVDENEEVYEVGETSAIVLSSASLVNKEYKVEQGFSREFSLLVILTDADAENLSLNLTSVPSK